MGTCFIVVSGRRWVPCPLRAHLSFVRAWKENERRQPNWSEDPVWIPVFVRLLGSRLDLLTPNTLDATRKFPYHDEDTHVTGFYVELAAFESVSVKESPDEVALTEDPTLRSMTVLVEFVKNRSSKIDDGVSKF